MCPFRAPYREVFKLMKCLTKMKTPIIAAALCGALMSGSVAMAGGTNNDLDMVIQTQKQLLEQLNEKKSQQYQQDLNTHMDAVEKQLDELKKQYGNYDAQGAITSLAAQMNTLQDQLNQQGEAQNKILLEVKSLKDQETQAMQNPAASETGEYYGTAATKNYLVNPGPSPNVGYTQDAINAQGDSTMVFSYSPSQLYKIYCKVGFLTDLQFKKGEKITYVGGGDTAKWIIDQTDVDGVPHLYLKPINMQSTTNIVVNTTKHSYQILANSSDWYNPMVKWSYGIEEKMANQLQQKKDDQIYTDKLSISRAEDLNFKYEIEGNAKWKPIMAFADTAVQKTYIQFDRMSKSLPILFIKEADKKELSLVNYKVKDKYFIIDKVFDEAQLRLSDNEVVTITAKSE